MTVQLDHLVVGCARLEEAEAQLSDLLGVAAQGSGKHDFMGTHNRVWSLGTAYLELIAVDPGARAPGRARWFALDDPATQARFEAGPALLTWVIRTDDLEALVGRDGTEWGRIETLARGDYRWKMAISEDGSLIDGGLSPMALQWLTPSPAERLPDSRLRVSGIVASGSCADGLRRFLERIAIDAPVEAQPSEAAGSLVARIVGPGGEVSLIG